MKTVKNENFWSLNEGTFYCLYDQKRTLAFRKAIYKTVRRGDIVTDIGAGSGVLSIFAATAGAKKVYAFENENLNYKSLKETVRLNGLQDQIIVKKADATNLKIPEKVDVIICEMIATGLIEELQVPAMNNALKYAKKGVKVILKKYEIYIDLVQHKNVFYNHEFDIIRYEFPDKKSLRSKPLSDRKQIKIVNFQKAVRHNVVQKSVFLVIIKTGIVNGIRISSRTIFSDNSELDHSLAYSFPVILPTENFNVKKGDKFKVDIYYEMCRGPYNLRYNIKKI